MGVCWDAAELNGLQSRPYGTDHLCVVVPPRHPLAGKRKVRFEDTLEFEQVSLPVNSAVQVMLQREASSVGGAGSTQTDLILLTHSVREGTMNDVLAQMQNLPTVLQTITRIRKEELA